jgi:hypothetical protein
MSDKGDTIRALADFIEKVSNSKWRSALTFGFFALALYTTYENRAQVWTNLSNNPVLAGLLGGGAILLFIGWGITNLQARIYARYDKEVEDKAERIKSLEGLVEKKDELIAHIREEIVRRLERIQDKLEDIK